MLVLSILKSHNLEGLPPEGYSRSGSSAGVFLLHFSPW
jgi:hypothetical protein